MRYVDTNLSRKDAILEKQLPKKAVEKFGRIEKVI